MRFVVPLFCFCISKQASFLSQSSVSKIYRLLLFGRVNTGEEMSSSLSASGALTFSSVRHPGSLVCNLRSCFESVDAILAELDTNRLNKLQSLSKDLILVTAIGTCNLPIESAVCFATSSFPILITWPRLSIYLVQRAHFFSFIVTPALSGILSTNLEYSIWSFRVSENITISSEYTRAYFYLAAANITRITRWNVAGSFFKPNGILIN